MRLSQLGGRANRSPQVVRFYLARRSPSHYRGQLIFSGLTPGSIGLYQVNIGIPATAPTGTQTLTLTVGGQSTTMSIPVQ